MQPGFLITLENTPNTSDENIRTRAAALREFLNYLSKCAPDEFSIMAMFTPLSVSEFVRVTEVLAARTETQISILGAHMAMLSIASSFMSEIGQQHGHRQVNMVECRLGVLKLDPNDIPPIDIEEKLNNPSVPIPDTHTLH